LFTNQVVEGQANPVPEPATCTTLGIGAMSLAGCGRRRRKSAVVA
jgi:hypothetical protein